MNIHEAYLKRVEAGMVDDTFRDAKGNPYLTRIPNGGVVPNGTAARDAKGLTRAISALAQPPKYPVRAT